MTFLLLSNYPSTGGREHAQTLAARIDRTPHVPRNFYVIDCACGWQSPLCKTQERANELYHAHRERKRARL